MMNKSPEASPAGAHGADLLPLRRRLRDGTAERHTRLDQRFDGMALADDPALYGRFLRMNEACHRTIEPILDRSALAGAFVDVRSPNLADALAADLHAVKIPPLNSPAFPVAAPDLAEAVGIAYVLEGSRLGARFILGQLRSRDLGPSWRGASFRYLEGAAERSPFKAFMNRADELLPAERDAERSSWAANATFDYVLALAALCEDDARLEAMPA